MSTRRWAVIASPSSPRLCSKFILFFLMILPPDIFLYFFIGKYFLLENIP